MVLTCEGRSVNFSAQTNEQKTITFFSYLIYTSTAATWKTVTLAVLSVLALVLNSIVIAWRCRRRNRRTNHSILAINLALSDILIAVTSCLRIAATMAANSWCQTGNTLLSAWLCDVAFLIGTAASETSVIFIFTIALFGFKEIVGCCGKTRETSKCTVLSVIVIEWITAIALTIGLHHPGPTWNTNHSVNWINCGMFVILPYNELQLKTGIVKTLGSLLIIFVGAFLYFKILLVARKRKVTDQKIRFRLLNLVVVSGALGLLLITWSFYVLVNAKSDYATLAKNKGFLLTFQTLGLLLPLLAVLNPFLYTFVTKASLEKIRVGLKRLVSASGKLDGETDQVIQGEDRASYGSDLTTKLFPATTTLTEICMEKDS